jgi:hypothetical protein
MIKLTQASFHLRFTKFPIAVGPSQRLLVLDVVSKRMLLMQWSKVAIIRQIFCQTIILFLKKKKKKRGAGTLSYWQSWHLSFLQWKTNRYGQAVAASIRREANSDMAGRLLASRDLSRSEASHVLRNNRNVKLEDLLSPARSYFTKVRLPPP